MSGFWGTSIAGALVAGVLSFLVASWTMGGRRATRRRAVVDWLAIVDGTRDWPEHGRVLERARAELSLLLGPEPPPARDEPEDDGPPVTKWQLAASLLAGVGAFVLGASATPPGLNWLQSGLAAGLPSFGAILAGAFTARVANRAVRSERELQEWMDEAGEALREKRQREGDEE